jgi:adenosylmethionine-8-amino-7-oxononanoate aminotransferase
VNREEIVALDKARVWHPYTAMRVYLEEVDPLVVVRAEGSHLFDASGKKYIDGNSSWWTATLGHRHPRIIAAAKKQMDSLDHCALAGIAHEQAAALAAELCDATGMTRVFYTDNGSTAIEAAVKMAVQVTGRKKFVALDGAFHGESVGATSLGGVEKFRRPYSGILFDCEHVPFPGDAIAKLLEREHDAIAAVVVEPILQGAAGMRIYLPSYLAELRGLHGLRAHRAHVGERARGREARFDVPRKRFFADHPDGRDARLRSRDAVLRSRSRDRVPLRPHLLRQPDRRGDRA